MISKKSKKIFFLILKLFISLFILWGVLTKIEFEKVFALFSQVSIIHIIILVILNFLSFIFMVLKWRILLIKYSNLNFRKLSSLYLASDFMNLFFLGVLGGEAYKVYYTKNRKASFITSIFDRLYSFYFYFIICALFILIYFFPKYLIEISFIFLVILVLDINFYPFFYDYLINKYKKMEFLKYAFISKIDMLKHFFYSFLYLLSVAFRFWFCFLIFGLNLNFYLILAMSAIVVIGISLPISIQGFGVREFIIIYFGSFFFGISAEIALAVSFLFYLSGLIYRLFGMIPFFLNKKET
ncbi:MAG: flippase-like domain-containing protein [Nanoarchaeota archaeon]|nr:flippase-like domain-containing protein [Nanoarchaeota archaeon]